MQADPRLREDDKDGGDDARWRLEGRHDVGVGMTMERRRDDISRETRRD